MSKPAITVDQAAKRGFPFFPILSLIFVVAKLTGHFAYSWWIVFLPVYSIFALALAVICLFIGVALAFGIIKIVLDSIEG